MIPRKGKAPPAEGGQAQLARGRPLWCRNELEEGKPKRLIGELTEGASKASVHSVAEEPLQAPPVEASVRVQMYL